MTLPHILIEIKSRSKTFYFKKPFFGGGVYFPPSPLFSHLPTSLKIYGHIVLGMVILLRFYFLTRTDLLHHLFRKKRTQCSKKCIWVVLQTVFVLYLTKKPILFRFKYVLILGNRKNRLASQVFAVRKLKDHFTSVSSK